MAKFNCVVFLGVVTVTIGMAMALTDDERNNIRAAKIPIMSACSQELGISKEEVEAAKQAKNIDALNPCYYNACFFKKIGVINDAGLYDVVAAKAAPTKYIHTQEDLDQLDRISETCASVNDQTVSDGAAGCERAKLLVQCLIDSKAKFSPLTE